MPYTIKTTDWKAKNFFALLRSLSEIPPHFYVASPKQKEEGQGLRFATAEFPDELANIKGHISLKECWCNPKARRPYAVLWRKKDASQKYEEGAREAARSLVHDLVHRFTDASLDMLSQELFATLRVENFRDISERFSGQKDSFTLGSKDVREFLSVSSEYYIQGEETFRAAYKQFLGDEKTTALYWFINDKIFIPNKN